MRITAITTQARHRDRVNLSVDGEFRLGLALEVAHALGLRVGDEVDERRLEDAAAADERWRAREAAMALLGYRARSAAELRRRLIRKQFPPAVVDEVIAGLADRGYLDDSAFAESFVRDRLGHRPRGRGRLVQELRARGVSADEAGEAVEAVFRQDAVAEEDLARAAAELWARKAGAARRAPDARRRLHSFLARRGFFGDAARAAAEAVLGAE